MPPIKRPAETAFADSFATASKRPTGNFLSASRMASAHRRRRTASASRSSMARSPSKPSAPTSGNSSSRCCRKPDGGERTCRISHSEYFYHMIENTIGEIEAKIHGATSISDERKRELLQLLGTLKSEVGTLAKTHGEQANSIAGFAEVSAHEATREKQNPESLRTFRRRACVRPSTALKNRIPSSSRSSTASATRCRIWGFEFASERRTRHRSQICSSTYDARPITSRTRLLQFNPRAVPASQSPP